ncbi:MAG: flagellar filament capping protein FliD [Planctomycetota bacterium]|nr:flagellar filament capping protein FliD [Planctomycetota bacterium]
MSFGPIQFGGLASGLDTGAIIQALLQVEAFPIQLLEFQKESEQSKLSLFGTLEGYVDSLRDVADGLSNGGGFFSYSITPSLEGVAIFTTSGSEAAVGSHTLNVLSLATADRYTFDAVADADTDLGGGDITFTYDGTPHTITIDPASSSLNEIAAQINTEAGDDVTASVINVGTESSPSYQLVLAGDDTGADFAIQSLTAPMLTGMTNLTPASNAKVEIDGLTVERSTNVFTDVLEGVSFTVTSEDSMSFSVEVDNEGVKANIEELITAYNKVINFINEQSEFSEEDGPGGDLFGDAALQTVRSTIQAALFNVNIDTVKADTEGYSTLGLIGIDVQTDGTLVMDETLFDEKLANDVGLLANLFTNETEGIAVKLEEAIGAMVDTTTNTLGDSIPGLFDRREDTLNEVIEDLDDQIENLERHLEQVEEGLVAKFSALEVLMAGLNAQAQFLSSQLFGLQG